jgi:hypothetical protein
LDLTSPPLGTEVIGLCQWFSYGWTMLEIKQIAGRLGLSEHQTRRILRALDPLLQGFIRRGRDNRILLDSGAVAILDRAVALWRDGIPLQSLYQAIANELNNAPSNGQEEAAGLARNPKQPAQDPCESYRMMVAHLEEEVRWLRSQLEELQQRALPPPRGSRWWLRLFRIRS